MMQLVEAPSYTSFVNLNHGAKKPFTAGAGFLHPPHRLLDTSMRLEPTFRFNASSPPILHTYRNESAYTVKP